MHAIEMKKNKRTKLSPPKLNLNEFVTFFFASSYFFKELKKIPPQTCGQCYWHPKASRLLAYINKITNGKKIINYKIIQWNEVEKKTSKYNFHQESHLKSSFFVHNLTFDRWSNSFFCRLFLNGWLAYSLASVFNNGTSFCVSIMFPVIFNLPFMNATCGFILPNAISTKSVSVTDNVVSGLTPSAGLPSYTVPFFKSSAETHKQNEAHTYTKNNKKKRMYKKSGD